MTSEFPQEVSRDKSIQHLVQSLSTYNDKSPVDIMIERQIKTFEGLNKPTITLQDHERLKSAKNAAIFMTTLIFIGVTIITGGFGALGFLLPISLYYFGGKHVKKREANMEETLKNNADHLIKTFRQIVNVVNSIKTENLNKRQNKSISGLISEVRKEAWIMHGRPEFKEFAEELHNLLKDTADIKVRLGRKFELLLENLPNDDEVRGHHLPHLLIPFDVDADEELQ